MAKYDFYRKRGNLNYRERGMLEDIARRIETNPELKNSIKPVNNIEELKTLHSTITSDVAEVIEEVDNQTIPKTESTTETKKPYIDPLNRESPIINDYVMDDQFDPFADYEKSKGTKSNFDEPKNYQQAFEIPDEDEQRGGGTPKTPRTANVRANDGDQLSPPNRRKAKRFATSIVNITCRLLEVGFVWYATKDINEQKLAEYELNGEMDLSLILELPDGQEATIKQFFLSQIPQIEQASKVSPDAKADLIEALTEVFIERNIQPSANYDLIISGVSLLAEQGIKLAMIVQQNNAILNQLRQQAISNPPNRPQGRPTNPNTPPPQNFDEDLAKQMEKDYKESQSMEDQYFSVVPTEAGVKQAEESILMDDIEMDEEMKNDLSLLDEIETKE